MLYETRLLHRARGEREVLSRAPVKCRHNSLPALSTLHFSLVIKAQAGGSRFVCSRQDKGAATDLPQIRMGSMHKVVLADSATFRCDNWSEFLYAFVLHLRHRVNRNEKVSQLGMEHLYGDLIAFPTGRWKSIIWRICPTKLYNGILMNTRK